MSNEEILKSTIGLTITAVGGLEKDSEEVFISLSDGRIIKMYHWQDCCEAVYLHDICGDESDLVGGVIVDFREDVKDGSDYEYSGDAFLDDSSTWTFYNISTSKGSVNMRWLGTSNGYYSERVTVEIA